MEGNSLKLKSYAKVNLYLNVGKKLDNGYHSIESIMQTINLFDEIYLTINENQGISIDCNNPEVPTDSKSIVYRAARILMEGSGKGINISIKKRIPLASGLGGGSSNVATVLKGICRLLRLQLSPAQLLNIATNLGMDIPFFLEGGLALAKGRGELISPLPPIAPPIPLILVNPGVRISTKWAYHLFDKSINNNIKNIRDITHFLSKNEPIKLVEIYDSVYNNFEPIISRHFPIIGQIKNRLKYFGSVATTISGSGSTVYGIFKRKKNMVRAYNEIKDEYPFVCKTYTL